MNAKFDMNLMRQIKDRLDVPTDSFQKAANTTVAECQRIVKDLNDQKERTDSNKSQIKKLGDALFPGRPVKKWSTTRITRLRLKIRWLARKKSALDELGFHPTLKTFWSETRSYTWELMTAHRDCQTVLNEETNELMQTLRQKILRLKEVADLGLLGPWIEVNDGCKGTTKNLDAASKRALVLIQKMLGILQPAPPPAGSAEPPGEMETPTDDTVNQPSEEF